MSDQKKKDKIKPWEKVASIVFLALAFLFVYFVIFVLFEKVV
ncbi:MAG: hypothetical protein U5K00_21725 [Melioribacteraceae bacterium]|nr:hypothetical protein [Melioribacteraceae bacterium]